MEIYSIMNHTMGPEQKTRIEEIFGKPDAITQISFPEINPRETNKDLVEKAKSLLDSINPIPCDVIHIMGEMGFTFAFVTEAKKRGLVCIHSTTERIVVEKDGRKTSTFAFVNFRAY